MRKYLFFFNIVVFSFLFFFLIPTPSAYAACSLTPSQQKIPFNFQGDITFTSSTPCFPSQPTPYQLIIYPKGIEDKPDLYNRYSDNNWNKMSNTGESTIKIMLDLNYDKYKIGGSWTVKFCQDLGKGVINDNCRNPQGKPNGGVIAQATLVISAAPTPTPIPPTLTPTPTPIPNDLPKLYRIPDDMCIYQAGEPIKFRVENVLAASSYTWRWYDGDSSLTNAQRTPPPTGTSVLPFPIEVPPTETSYKNSKGGDKKYTLCIDRIISTGAGRCTPGAQNTVEVMITKDKPIDSSCSNPILAATPTPAILPTDTPVPPALLPCLEGEDAEGKATTDKALIKKCTKIDSAIGEVPTDPAAFIKTIFTVLLSMASGWATYLIITAGYQLMFSGHDAEKVQEARDKITSAIVGLVFMILSLIILRVIGVDIFQLPTFG